MTEAGQGGIREFFQRPWSVLSILFLIYMCHAMDRHVLSFLAEPVRKDLGLSDTQLGLLNGLAFAFFYTLLGLPVGWLADRIGRVLTIAGACLVWTVCSMLGSLAGNFGELALARIGVAMGESGGTAPAYALIADKFAPADRGRAYGVYHIGSSVGVFVGAALAGWVAAHYGWRMALIAVSLPGLVAASALYLLVREPDRRAGGPAADDVVGGMADLSLGDVGRTGEHPGLWRSLLEFLRHPVLGLVFVFAGFTAFMTQALIAWLPAFLMRVKGMSMAQIGEWYSVCFALSFGLGLWLGGFLTDRFARYSAKAYALVPAASLAIAIPFILAAVAVKDWQTSLTLWIVPLVLSGVFLAPAVALVQLYTPPRQATVFGSIYLLANNMVAGGGGPLYVGWVSDAFKASHGSNALMFGILALVPVMAVAICGQLLIARSIGRHPAGFAAKA